MIANYLSITIIQNHAVTLSDLGLIEQNITRALKISRNTFQTAQFHHLSINLLRPGHLRANIHEVDKGALLKGTTLFPNKPSDLFQLELSCMFEGEKQFSFYTSPLFPWNPFFASSGFTHSH